jgi:hypothetical protein
VKRTIIGTAVLALGLAGLGTSYAGTDDGQGAQKRGLFPTTSTGQCDPSATDAAGSADGFAILNAPGQVGSVKKIVGEVSLKTGTPGTTYMVELADDSGACMPVGSLTANAQGNGNAHINFPVTSPLAATYYVVLTEGANEVFASAPVPLI